jgi:hypothetical protein
MARNLSEGSAVRYRGDLPEDWEAAGIVVALTPDTSVATVQFGDPGAGHLQDIPVTELDRGWQESEYGGDYTVTIAADGQEWTWAGYAKHRTDALYRALDAVEEERRSAGREGE